jgi:hypothetical protein
MRATPSCSFSASLLMLLFAACGSGSGGGGDDQPPPVSSPPPPPPANTPGPNNPGGTPPPPAGTFNATYFLDGYPTLNAAGAWHTRGFTLNGTRNLVFRLATNYATQAAIIEPSQYDNFTSGAAFTGYAGFSSQYGYKSVTLGPGNYYVAIRNVSNGSNSVRYELDYGVTLSSGSYSGALNQTTTILAAGQRRWESLTLQSGRRYWIDGCNSGLDAFVIDASELPAFQSGASFLHYTDFGGSNAPDVYGGIELDLAPGNYFLVQRNLTSRPQSVNYVVQSWNSTASVMLESTIEPTPEEPQLQPQLSECPPSLQTPGYAFAGSGCGAETAACRMLVGSEPGHRFIGLQCSIANVPAILVAGSQALGLRLGDNDGCRLLPSPEFLLTTQSDHQGRAAIAVPEAVAAHFIDTKLQLQWVVPPTADSPLQLSEAAVLLW